MDRNDLKNIFTEEAAPNPPQIQPPQEPIRAPAESEPQDRRPELAAQEPEFAQFQPPEAPQPNPVQNSIDLDSSARKARLYTRFAKILAILGTVLLIIAYAPSVWYFTASKAGIELNTKTIGETVINQPPVVPQFRPAAYQPPYDSSLPLKNRLIIKSAGIDTEIYEAPEANFEDALKKGVWRVSNFGTPFERELPTIMAAHRFGYLRWSVPYRLKNSFYNLPKLKIGDTVEIIWKQRKYVYAVYGEEEGEAISDYSANLILYTCKDLNSKVRIFKYAKLIEI